MCYVVLTTRGGWSEDFYRQDIADTFERIFILFKYGAFPYVMRYEKCYSCRYSGMYSAIAAWANQPALVKKLSFREFCILSGNGKKGARERYMEEFEREHPEIAKKYFDMKRS